LRADDGTVQPLRSREIKAAVASHTQFEHMKKGGQRSSGKPTEGLTSLLQGANKITVPAIFPVTSNVIINCDSPEVPSAAKTQKASFFPSSARCTLRPRITEQELQRLRERAAGRRRDRAPRRMRWRNDFTPYRAPACSGVSCKDTVCGL
jgi:hypothetical protein